VEGLGFFHIPHKLSHKQSSESWSALIRVLDGHLSSHNVVSELERLTLGLGHGTWRILAITLSRRCFHQRRSCYGWLNREWLTQNLRKLR
jgi:hypothetical protein